jgi:TonB-linked SusC/RagA family outer membrane protein
MNLNYIAKKRSRIRFLGILSCLLLLLTTFLNADLYAQNTGRTVTGTVTDEQLKPVAGVSVNLVGTNEGDVTDPQGKYKIHINSNQDSLAFSHLNFDTKTLMVGQNSILNVILYPKQDAGDLDQVVVVGYGTQKKVSVTGGVDVVKAKAFAGRAVVNVAQALQGTAPSLVIQQQSFEPGQGVTLNLRGVGTLGDNSPLVVIDGLVGGNLNNLNPNDIESVSVLKDAGSAAIYGSRAANGVILVTTKKGKAGHNTLNYNGIVSQIHPHILVQPVDGYENMILKDQALVNSGQQPIYSPLDIQAQYQKGNQPWFLKEIFKDATQQNHNLSLSGGAGNTTYMLSGGFMDQQSNFIGPAKGVRRYNYRMNLSTELGRLKVSSSIAYTRNEIRDHSYSTGTLVVDAERTPPLYPYQDSLGRYLINDVLAQFNPIGILNDGGFRRYDNDNVFGTISGDLKIIDGLSLRGVFGGSLDANHEYFRTDYVPFYRAGAAIGADPAGLYGNEKGTTTGDQNNKNILLNTQLLLQYEKQFGKHNFMVMGGYTTESQTYHANHVQLNYTSPDMNLPGDSTMVNVGDQGITPQGSWETALNSYIGRLTYNYDNKYFFEGNFRVDGSSKFAAENRWGFFPSVSGGWILSREDFYKNSKISDVVNYLKLRSSYGVLGNQNVGNFQYQTTYQVYSNGYVFNGNTPVSTTGFQTANPDLKWESAHTFNIGADVNAFNNKINITFDYFDKLTKNILQRPNLPGTFGGSQVDFNIASVRNRGWEFTINYNSKGALFSHNLTFNMGDTHNEIVKMANDQDRIETHDEMQMIYAEGLPIGSYVGLKRAGYFQNLDDVNNLPKFVGLEVVPGDNRYVDKNGDGVIDDNDRFVLGNPFPRYTFGLNYDLGYKGFDLNVFVQGVGKRDMDVRGELVEPFHVNYSYVIFKHQLDYWRPDNKDAAMPRLAVSGSASNTNNFRKGSDMYIFNAAYARLKNVQIGYSLSPKICSHLGIQKFRVYLTGQNLLTLSKMDFLDPENTEFSSNVTSGGSNSGRAYPTLEYYGFGVDVTF